VLERHHHDAALAKLSDAGHPVLRLCLNDPMDSARVLPVELATAHAGAVLGYPSTSPNGARQGADSTLLAEWKRSRRLPDGLGVEEDGLVS